MSMRVAVAVAVFALSGSTFDTSGPGLLSFAASLGAFNFGGTAFGYSGAALVSGAFEKDGTSTPWRVSGDLTANLDVARLDKIEARIGENEKALSMQGAAEAYFGAAPRLNVSLAAKEMNVDALLRGKG